jgi:hypothetical protein
MMTPMRLFKAVALLALALMPAVVIAATFQAFKPGGQTVLVSATTTAASVTLQGAGGSLLVFNACAVTARVDATGNTATPTAGTPGSTGIPAGNFALLEIGAFASTVSVKVDSGSACNVELTRGEGMAH